MPEGFLLAEDAAVKARFSGLTVTDDRKAARPVKVFFRHPEGETEREYPFITIENVGISHARNLQHSEQYHYFSEFGSNETVRGIDYYPSEKDATSLEGEVQSNGYLRTSTLVPVYLVYQVSTHTRSALHDRQLTGRILRTVSPFRTGTVLVPEDGTARRFELLNWGNSDVLDQESGYRKRIFRKVYTFQMTAEIPTSDLVSVKRVASVIGNIQSADNADSYDPYVTFSEDF